ncbi:MAG TPA: hypothetical protein VIP30_08040 [Stenotrophomonas sp.]
MKLKFLLIAATAAVALASAKNASAQDNSGPIPEALIGAKIDTRTDAAALAAPVGALLTPMIRLWNAKWVDRFSSHEWPANWDDLGWVIEGTIGYVSVTQFQGSHPLFNCFTGYTPGDKYPDSFTSVDPNCEGQGKSTYQPIIGWVADAQIEGTVPLYRCDTPGTLEDHFDTTSPICEGNKPGAVLNGILGYIFL